MTDTTPLGLIVVRLKVPVKNYPVGTELGYKDVADAIAALGSAYFFEVVRDQQGNPIPPLTPEEIEAAQRAAQRRAKSRRLILGADFDPLWNRVEGIPDADELDQMRQDVEAVADVPPRVEAVEQSIENVRGILNPERTLSVIGDLHIGFTVSGPEQQAAADVRMDETFADLATLAASHVRHVFLGDQIEFSDATGTAVGWRDADFLARANALPRPWDAIVGNHDITSTRTPAHWAEVYGYDAPNWVRDLGFVRLIALAPESSSPASDLSSDTLAWLETELRRSRKDTLLLTHYPPFGTVGTNPESSPFHAYGGTIQPDTELRALLGRYTQVRGWLVAHRHPNLQTAPDVFTHVWLGTRSLPVINAGAPVYTDYRVGPLGDDPPRSLFVTVLDDRLEVRVRNHRDRAWETYTHRAVYPMRYRRPNEQADEANPATMVATFDGQVVARDASGPVAPSITGAQVYDSSVGGRTGLQLTTAKSMSWDVRPWVGSDEGTIVVRARFTAPSHTSSEYLINHNPGGDNRLYVMRLSDGTVVARMGSAAISATAPDPGDNTDIHTFGLSWKGGWHGLFYVDGVKAGETRSNSLTTAPITLGNVLRTGYLANATVYDVYMAGRVLSEEEHAQLHAHAEPWTWDVLDPFAPRIATAPPAPPDDPPSDNPIVAVATFDGEITATDTNGPVALSGSATTAPTYDSAAGPTGLMTTSSQALIWDASPYVTTTEGSFVVRGRFTGASHTSSEYMIFQNPGTNNRIYVLRAANGVLRAQVGAGNVAATHPTQPFTDTGIHTFGVSWYEGDTMEFYLDGVLVGTASSSSALTEIGADFRSPSLANAVVYEQVFAGRRLQATEHAALHAAAVGTWSLDTLA